MTNPPNCGSTHLSAELNRLIELTIAIRNSGSVAPNGVWLTSATYKKGKKIYTYGRLVSDNPTFPGKLLSKPADVQDWKARCDRREAIAELEVQIRLLTELIDRQVNCPVPEFTKSES
jgi:hypothetical protein